MNKKNFAFEPNFNLDTKIMIIIINKKKKEGVTIAYFIIMSIIMSIIMEFMEFKFIIKTINYFKNKNSIRIVEMVFIKIIIIVIILRDLLLQINGKIEYCLRFIHNNFRIYLLIIIFKEFIIKAILLLILYIILLRSIN